LHIKGLPYTTKWLDLVDIPPEMKKLGIASREVWDGNLNYTVPSIFDPNTKRAVTDSFEIAKYLDAEYPATTPIVPPGTRALQAAMTARINEMMFGIWPITLPHIFATLGERDVEYFRASREKWFSKKFEDIAPTGEKHEEAVKGFERALGEVGGWIDAGGPGAMLLGGDTPNHSDTEFASLLIFVIKVEAEGSVLRKTLANADNGRWVRYIDVGFSEWTKRTT
jgi:glutathione S-transferase